MTLHISIKRLHPEAELPTKAHESDAAFDLCATDHVLLEPGNHASVETGIALDIPRGWYGQILSRSGMFLYEKVSVRGGVIDSGYLGPIRVLLQNESKTHPFFIKPGMRVAQIAFARVPDVVFEQVQDFARDTERGVAGMGSTGYHKKVVGLHTFTEAE